MPPKLEKSAEETILAALAEMDRKFSDEIKDAKREARVIAEEQNKKSEDQNKKLEEQNKMTATNFNKLNNYIKNTLAESEKKLSDNFEAQLAAIMVDTENKLLNKLKENSVELKNEFKDSSAKTEANFNASLDRVTNDLEKLVRAQAQEVIGNVDEKIKGLVEQHENLLTRVEHVVGKVDALDNKLDVEINNLTSRMDKITLDLEDKINEGNDHLGEELNEKIDKYRNDVCVELGAISNDVSKVDKSLRYVQNEVQKNTERQDLIDKEIEEIRNRPSSSSSEVRVVEHFIELPSMKDFSDNPMEYLRLLERTVRLKNLKTWDSIKALIGEGNSIHDNPWWYLNQGDVLNYNDFLEKYKKKFWSPAIQNIARERLETGKYYRMGKQSMSEYFLKKAILARNFDPPMDEEVLVIKLAQHFDEPVRNARMSGNIVTISGFEQLLQTFDNEVKLINMRKRKLADDEGKSMFNLRNRDQNSFDSRRGRDSYGWRGNTRDRQDTNFYNGPGNFGNLNFRPGNRDTDNSNRFGGSRNFSSQQGNFNRQQGNFSNRGNFNSSNFGSYNSGNRLQPYQQNRNNNFVTPNQEQSSPSKQVHVAQKESTSSEN